MTGEHEPGVEESGVPGDHLRAVLPQDPPHSVQQSLPRWPHRSEKGRLSHLMWIYYTIILIWICYHTSCGLAITHDVDMLSHPMRVCYTPDVDIYHTCGYDITPNVDMLSHLSWICYHTCPGYAIAHDVDMLSRLTQVCSTPVVTIIPNVDMLSQLLWICYHTYSNVDLKSHLMLVCYKIHFLFPFAANKRKCAVSVFRSQQTNGKLLFSVNFNFRIYM